MHRYATDTDTQHLFESEAVRKRTGTETITSLCGSVETTGGFVKTTKEDARRGDEDWCENCLAALEDE